VSKKKSQPAPAEPKPPKGAFPGGKVTPEPGELRIAVDRIPYAEIIGHAVVEPDIEVCGVLVGSVGEDEHGSFVHVRHAIRGQAARQAGASVTFTHETWNHIHQEMDQRYPDDEIVGWYHTHGGFGVFLSEDDTFIHQSFFTAPHHLAYVYDPLAGSEGFFVRKGEDPGQDAGKLVPVKRYWLGGRERRPAMRMPEPEPGPGPGPGPGLVFGTAGEVATELKKLAASLQWSREREAEAGGWMSWVPWIVTALALAMCFMLVQRREPERSRDAVLVVDTEAGTGRLIVLPLVAVPQAGDAAYVIADEHSGLELRSPEGVVMGRFLGVAALEQKRLADEQRRSAEAAADSAATGKVLRWALIVLGGIAALAAAAGAAWWFFLRRT
jgi:proteasome lid subunit RPN8/RPN11